MWRCLWVPPRWPWSSGCSQTQSWPPSDPLSLLLLPPLSEPLYWATVHCQSQLQLYVCVLCVCVWVGGCGCGKVIYNLQCCRYDCFDSEFNGLLVHTYLAVQRTFLFLDCRLLIIWHISTRRWPLTAWTLTLIFTADFAFSFVLFESIFFSSLSEKIIPWYLTSLSNVSHNPLPPTHTHTTHTPHLLPPLSYTDQLWLTPDQRPLKRLEVASFPFKLQQCLTDHLWVITGRVGRSLQYLTTAGSVAMEPVGGGGGVLIQVHFEPRIVFCLLYLFNTPSERAHFRLPENHQTV